MKIALCFILLLSSITALADRRPGYVRTFEDFLPEVNVWSEPSPANCELMSKAMSIAYQAASTASLSHDCDISTAQILYSGRGYGARSCSIALNGNGHMMGYVGCGYNNTDERIFLYLDPKTIKVVKIER